MNAESSRAHTVFQIRFKQVRIVKTGDKELEQAKESQINLIDLAGSERLDKTGATGQTLKEGQEINKSLSTLGRVIEILAKQSQSKTELFVPYRDSKLTMLLQDALGGNSKTIMICAVSPAANNYDESLSTLRYADRAKQIKNKAVVNEDPQAARIRELEQEVKKLKELLGTSGIDPTISKGLTDEQSTMLMSQLKDAEEIITQLSMTNEEKERAAAEKERLREEALADSGISMGEMGMMFGFDAKEVCRLVNLREDPHFNENLFYFINPDGSSIGSHRDNSILLEGPRILERHCTIRIEDGQPVIEKSSPDALVFINGEKIDDKHMLHTNDRVILGGYAVFRFVNPKEQPAAIDEIKIIDWEFAQQEMRKEEEAFKEKIRLMNEEFQLEREKREQELYAQLKALEQRRADMESDIVSLKADEEQRRQLQKTLDDAITKLRNDRDELQNTDAQEKKNLVDLMQNVHSMGVLLEMANEMSRELKKRVQYTQKIVIKNNVPVAHVEVRDRKHDSISMMTFSEFENRVAAMQEIHQSVREHGENALNVLLPQDDPFYHLVRVVGEATIDVNALARGALKDQKIDIYNPLKGRVQGKIIVDFESDMPLHEGGFVGKDLKFTLHIRSLESVHRKLSERTFVQYKTMFDQDIVSTNVVNQPDKNRESRIIPYNWRKGYFVPSMLVDDDELHFFASGTITFIVFGFVGEGHKNRISRNEKATTSPSADLSGLDGILRENEELKRQLSDMAKKQISTVTDNIRNINQLYSDMNEVRMESFSYLEVNVLQAENLPKMDIIGRGDPYVVLNLRKSSAKTEVIMNTSNPVWRQTFKFVLTPSPKDVLFVSLYDWDRYTSDDKIGSVKIPFTVIQENQRRGNTINFFPIDGKKCKDARILLELRFML